MCPVPNILLIYTDDHDGAAGGPWRDVKAELPVHGRLRRLHRLARASDRPVEELVVSALDESVPRPPPNLPRELCDELSLLETLSNRDLVEVAQSTLKADEVPSLYQPGDVTDRLALRKAYALVLLKWRGRPLPELERLAG